MSSLYVNTNVRTLDVLEFTLASQSASTNQYQPVIWNVTPTLKTGFPNYSTSLWTQGGSQFSPGILGPGVYTITINYNMNGAASPSELFVLKNTPLANTFLAPGTPSLIGASMMTNLNYEGTCHAIFNAVLSSDYVSFVYNTGVTTSQRFCQSGIEARTTLRITRDAAIGKFIPNLQTVYNQTFSANPLVPTNLQYGTFVGPSTQPWIVALTDVDTTAEYNSGDPNTDLPTAQAGSIAASTKGWAVVLVGGNKYYGKSGSAGTSNPYAFFSQMAGFFYFSGYVRYASNALSCCGYVDPPSGTVWVGPYGLRNTSAPVVLNGTQTPYTTTITYKQFIAMTATTLAQFILANAPIFTTINAGSAWNLDASQVNPVLSYYSIL
jgi:hypothetical protein